MKTINFKSEKTVDLSSIRDLFGISDDWELRAWPISYNESVSFIFSKREDGDVIDNGGEQDYRHKIVTVSNFDFSLTQTKDIILHGACLVNIFFWENGYAYAVRDENDVYSVIFYDKNENEISKINLGPNVSRLMVAKDGRVAFGYIGTFPNNLPCFAILSSDGKTLYECNEDSARACMDLTVDKKDSIWASCYPDVQVYEINTDNTVIPHRYPVASPDGLIPFDLNGKTATILSYSNDEVYVPINYLYVDEKLAEIRFDDLDPHDVESISAYAGLVVLLTKDQKLRFFKLDEISKVLE